MAISYGATGITASSDVTTPFANLSYTLPASSQQYDLLVVFYGGKPYNTVPSTPTDYTARSGGANGSTGMGSGTGSVYAVAFTKEHDGSESNPASTFSAQYSPGIRAALWVRESARFSGSWTVTSCKGSDATATGTTYSATGDATLNYTVGDVAVVLLVHNDDSSGDSSFGLDIPGCTIKDLTQQLTCTLTTATGNDGRMYVLTAEIDTGTASGAPVVTATTGSSDSDGQSVFLRLQRPAVQLPATAEGSLTLGGTAGATTATTTTGTLTLGGSVTAAAPAAATGSLTLGGTGVASLAATGTGSLTLAGSAAAQATATAAGSLTLAGSAAATGQGLTSGALTFAGSATATTTATATGGLTLGGTTTGRAPATTSGTLVLSGTVTAAAGVTATGSLVLGGTAVARKATAGRLTFGGVVYARGLRGAVTTVHADGPPTPAAPTPTARTTVTVVANGPPAPTPPVPSTDRVRVTVTAE